jgi:phosphatidylserine decarboxylase
MIGARPQPLPTTPRAPQGVQPGGGACLSLELAWGRLRRAYLRRLRPGYVRRWAALRQGYCPDCAHDVIDPRDLKFVRNVCGYWFREEDDPFRWRGRLGLAREGLAEVVCFSLLFAAASALVILGTVVIHGAVGLALPAVLLLWFESVRFFRDPRRPIPTEPGLVLSPADGTVTQLEEVEEPDFPGGRAFRVSIFLSVFDVHVNRVPVGGRVVHLRYFPGRFWDARRPECASQNEQLWIDLEEADTQRPVRVKQISGAVARRIVCWLRRDETVQPGERFGMIKFGSRTDVLVPAGEAFDVQVAVGDRVKGGSDVLLRYRGHGGGRAEG